MFAAKAWTKPWTGSSRRWGRAASRNDTQADSARGGKRDACRRELRHRRLLVCYDKSMSNRILRVQVRSHLLDPAQAELWITASAEHLTPTTELRGRLAGPRCLYAATVEVGYPLRPFSRRPEGLEGLAAHVVIPEPSLWEPQCPFVYQGMVELWQDGERRDQVPIRRGLRRGGDRTGGLRVNGRLLALRGRVVAECDERQFAALHRSGGNLLLAETTECLTELLPLADVYGFFVLGMLTDLTSRRLGTAPMHRRITRPF